MKIESNQFSEGGLIPRVYTCDGAGLNPPLQFSDIPANARSLVLIIEDPDVPKSLRPDGMFDHWVLWNIDPHSRGIDTNEHISAIVGANTTGKTGYIAPCPPNGEHRYFFKLYALDMILGLPEGSRKEHVLAAIEGHVIVQAELMGRYGADRKKQR